MWVQREATTSISSMNISSPRFFRSEVLVEPTPMIRQSMGQLDAKIVRGFTLRCGLGLVHHARTSARIPGDGLANRQGAAVSGIPKRFALAPTCPRCWLSTLTTWIALALLDLSVWLQMLRFAALGHAVAYLTWMSSAVATAMAKVWCPWPPLLVAPVLIAMSPSTHLHAVPRPRRRAPALHLLPARRRSRPPGRRGHSHPR
mmetsp:Transcript_21725/g.74682  ORF Transcript_21725/g.74682 Transcript_21725/m.74682 type:complete len:202 (+) Transcript_21725:800-1405(+)